jgi:hypothetical protein
MCRRMQDLGELIFASMFFKLLGILKAVAQLYKNLRKIQ